METLFLRPHLPTAGLNGKSVSLYCALLSVYLAKSPAVFVIDPHVDSRRTSAMLRLAQPTPCDDHVTIMGCLGSFSFFKIVFCYFFGDLSFFSQKCLSHEAKNGYHTHKVCALSRQEYGGTEKTYSLGPVRTQPTFCGYPRLICD